MKKLIHRTLPKHVQASSPPTGPVPKTISLFTLNWVRNPKKLHMIPITNSLTKATVKNFNKQFSILLETSPKNQAIKSSTSNAYLDLKLTKNKFREHLTKECLPKLN